MEIKRDIYLNRLIVRKHNGFIKVITGIRRSGKSYLLNTLFYHHLLEEKIAEDHIIKFAFDSADDLLKIGEDPIVLDNEREDRKVDPSKFLNWLQPQIADKEMHYILLDEVQKLGAFESVMNGFLRKSNLDVYVTGSNAKFLSSDIITEFRGRGDQIYLTPLSFKEYYDYCKMDFEDAWNEYSMYGGMPFLLTCKTDEQKIHYLENLFAETYIKDIVNRNNIRDTGVLEDVLNVVSSSVGSLTNPNKLSNSFKSIKNIDVAPNTIKQYLDYCIDSFLLQKAYRYDVKGKKYIDTPLKYYFTDIGLRNARLGFRQQEESHIMENIIFNELITRGYKVDVGVVTVSEKNENGNYVRKNLEVDFVCNLGYQRYYIQSALAIDDAEKKRQEEKSLLNIHDSFRKIIIVRNNIKKWMDDNGTLFLSLKEFLINPDSMKA